MKKKVKLGLLLIAIAIAGVTMLNGCQSGSSSDPSTGPTFTLKSSNSAN